MNGLLANASFFGQTGNPLGPVSGADFIAVLLLILLVSILSIAVFFVWLATSHVRASKRMRPRRRLHASTLHAGSLESGWATAIAPVPNRWLAIHDVSQLAVQNALGLNNPVECSCVDGIQETDERRLFITPRIGEWVLVFGAAIPDPFEDVDHSFHFLRKLSQKVGLVQFFGSNRPTGFHSWALLNEGHVGRAYSWAGETQWNQGPLTNGEIDLKMRCLEYGEGDDLPWLEINQMAQQNLEKVSALAAQWSIDPTAVNWQRIVADSGVVGDIG